MSLNHIKKCPKNSLLCFDAAIPFFCALFLLDDICIDLGKLRTKRIQKNEEKPQGEDEKVLKKKKKLYDPLNVQ